MLSFVGPNNLGYFDGSMQAVDDTTYFAWTVSYACKMCIKSLTGADVMKHFSLSLSHKTNKLERLSLML
jgi:hypothetical protein